MKTGRIPILVVIVCLFIFLMNASATVFSQARTGAGHKLTIYVDEGKGELNGHVFLALTDGRTTEYFGWYSDEKLLAPLALGGGNVLPDTKLGKCGWDVKKSYDISPEAYDAAKQGIVKWNTEGRAWALNHHCGDFVETIAQMAGTGIKLPERATGRNRPELFGDYLRAHGGEVSADTYYINSFVNTGISLGRGDKVTINATGSVEFGPWVGSGGPNGILIDPSYNYFVNVRHGALLMRVRTPGERDLDGWSFVGKGREMTSLFAGVLEFLVNDNDPKNNKGKFEVQISVCRSR